MSLLQLFEQTIDTAVKEIQGQFETDPSFFVELKKVFMKYGTASFGTVTVTVSNNGVTLGSTSTTNASNTAVKVKRHRSKTGYNLYVAEQFNLVKQGTVSDPAGAEVLPKDKSKLRMKAFASSWSLLTVKQKTVYNERAKTIVVPESTSDSEVVETTTKASSRPQAGTSTATDGSKVKKVSGYNVFYRLNKDTIKAGLQEGEKFMTVIGNAWTGLTPEGKDQYNALANRENTSTDGYKANLTDLSK